MKRLIALYKLILFFNIKGIVMVHWVPYYQNVNKSYYVDVLQKLWNRIGKMISELLTNNSLVLYHDNATRHHAAVIEHFFWKKHVNDAAHCLLELLPKVQMLVTLLTIGYLKNGMGIISIRF